MEKFNIQLTQQELDVVINGLAELPFKVANGIVNSIIEQFRAQQQQPQTVAAE